MLSHEKAMLGPQTLRSSGVATRQRVQATAREPAKRHLRNAKDGMSCGLFSGVSMPSIPCTACSSFPFRKSCLTCRSRPLTCSHTTLSLAFCQYVARAACANTFEASARHLFPRHTLKGSSSACCRPAWRLAWRLEALWRPSQAPRHPRRHSVVEPH